MKECSNCINNGMHKSGCRTMLEPFDEYACWMDVDMAIKAEQAIMKVCIQQINPDALLQSRRYVRQLTEIKNSTT